MKRQKKSTIEIANLIINALIAIGTLIAALRWW